MKSQKCFKLLRLIERLLTHSPHMWNVHNFLISLNTAQ